jgi:hypothetical protein
MENPLIPRAWTDEEERQYLYNEERLDRADRVASNMTGTPDGPIGLTVTPDGTEIWDYGHDEYVDGCCCEFCVDHSVSRAEFYGDMSCDRERENA